MASPTADPELNEVLRALALGAHEVLGDRLVGAVLVGSFATGHADAHSDLDFVMVVDSRIPWPELAALQSFHESLHASGSVWATRLDGSYVPSWILRRADPTRKSMPYLDNGSARLAASTHCNWLVQRWLVREHGIALFGPEPRSWVDPIAPQALQREAHEMLEEWRDEIRAEPQAMNNRWYQPYAVVGFCRILYTACTGGVAAKSVAAAWARERLDPTWAGLIDAALSERPDAARKAALPADPEAFERTLAFLEMVRAEVASALQRIERS